MEKEILKICMEKGFLLDKEMLGLLSELEGEDAKRIIETLKGLKIEERVITKSVFSKNIEKIRNVFVGGKNKTVIENFFVNLGYSRVEVDVEKKKQEEGSVKILYSPVFTPRKIRVKDFVTTFKNRYEQIRNILRGRDLEGLTSLRRIGNDRDSYCVIVSVNEKRVTKNKNLLLDVEDLTGRARILVNNNKEELFQKCQDLMMDDIVAFKVSGNNDWLYANEIIFPDSFLQEKRRHDKEVLVAFTSDLHLGSTMFLEENLNRFIRWLNCQEGDEKQRALARKVKYLFITGDSVDGVGVFPGQEHVLIQKDFRAQYKHLAELLGRVRKDIKIILGPGQHDAVWVGHPQPMIGEKWAPELCEMENIILVTNPALIQIDGGFKILIYHGAGMHTFVEAISDIRLNYKHDSPTRVIKEILKRRHLMPSHGALCDYIPIEKFDPLVISEVPDIIATGDWHKADVGVYNNVLMIASSCWQSVTPFEEKVGNNPDPCKVPLLNLKTREVKILDFSDSVETAECEEKEEELVCEVKK